MIEIFIYLSGVVGFWFYYKTEQKEGNLLSFCGGVFWPVLVFMGVAAWVESYNNDGNK